MIDYNIELMTNVIDYNKQRYKSFIEKTDFVFNNEFEKILNARNHKVQRIKKRFLYLLVRYKYVWFCTFTFSDEYINRSERTKRDLIKNCINIPGFYYILNVDYGSETERQHFHCLLATDIDVDLDLFFGFVYPCHTLSIKCKNGLEDFVKLSKYINKLVNHCLKSTTNRQRIVYNFKGYDSFCPDSRTKTLQYNFEYDYLFKYVPLLDKGDINGNLS